MRTVDVSAAPAGVESAPETPAALLTAALAARDAGDLERAIQLSARLAADVHWISDYADRLRVASLLAAGRPADAVAGAEEALLAHPSSLVRFDLYASLGAAYHETGAEVAARHAWRAALELEPESARSGPLAVSIAESLEASGNLEAATSGYLEVWRSRPGSPEDKLVASRLDALEVRTAGSLRSGSDTRQRADAFYAARRNGEALASYDAALAQTLPKEERRRALEQRARTLFRLRRYEPAAKAFGDLLPDHEARLWQARAIARDGHPKEAAQRLERLGRQSHGTLKVRALFLAADLWDGEERHSHARKLWREIAAQRTDRRLARSARWELGWLAYQKGRYGEAAKEFARLQGSEPDVIRRLRSRYWEARALGELGRSEASEKLAAIAGEFPISYYGWRAAGRLGEFPDPNPTPAPAPTLATLAPQDLDRVRLLLEAGLAEDATRELGRLRHRAEDLQGRMVLAQLYNDAGEPHQAQLLIVGAYLERLARGPSKDLEELWWLAWPWAYGDLVSRVTSKPGQVAPEVVSAVMREESGYRPRVVSPVGARGLLQIMPATGKRLANDLGVPFDADDLFRPEFNIRLGAHYLTELETRFDGRRSAAIGSYNAGPNAVARWLRKRPTLDDDEWVEAIPYDQTRSYVKRVLRSVHAYKVLY